MKLPLSEFTSLIKHAPLVSIDLLVVNENQQILLGLRKNRPAQGFWFVPGGRIFKDESFQDAFKRITLNELGISFDYTNAEFLGHFDHFYPDNVTGESFSTHYLAVGYTLTVKTNELRLPVDQHSDYCWMSRKELLTHEKVHRHTRWYLDPSA